MISPKVNQYHVVTAKRFMRLGSELYALAQRHLVAAGHGKTGPETDALEGILETIEIALAAYQESLEQLPKQS